MSIIASFGIHCGGTRQKIHKNKRGSDRVCIIKLEAKDPGYWDIYLSPYKFHCVYLSTKQAYSFQH